jgi:ribonuclease HI
LSNFSEPLVINSDGAARGNPGPAGIGGIIQDAEGNIIKEFSEFIGKATNNVAEYKALIKALQLVNELKATIVHANLDSELVVKQINGEYKIKNEGLKPLFWEVKSLLSKIKYQIKYVPREQNKRADKLANEAIDSQADVNAGAEGGFNKQDKLFNL